LASRACGACLRCCASACTCHLSSSTERYIKRVRAMPAYRELVRMLGGVIAFAARPLAHDS